MPPVDIETQLTSFTEACRERGMPVTHQRLAVFRALLESESHPDADEIHKRLRGAYPTLSLGTMRIPQSASRYVRSATLLCSSRPHTPRG